MPNGNPPKWEHYALSGRDMYSRTPRERGHFAWLWRYRKHPLPDELVVFSETGDFERAMAEFELGVQDARAKMVQGERETRRQEAIWLEFLDAMKM